MAWVGAEFGANSVFGELRLLLDATAVCRRSGDPGGSATGFAAEPPIPSSGISPAVERLARQQERERGHGSASKLRLAAVQCVIDEDGALAGDSRSGIPTR